MKKRLTGIFTGSNLVAYFYGFCIFLLMKPYFMWGYYEQVNVLIVYALSFIGIFNLRKAEKLDLLIIPIFALLLLSLASDAHANFMGYISSLLILFYFVIDRKVMLKYYKCFKTILVISLFLSLIVYALVVLSYPVGYSLIDPLNPLKYFLYKQYPFLVMPNEVINVEFPRFYGVFDEPGVIGTFAGIMLFAERYNLKKISNIILFVSGVFSFSLFFILLSAVAILYFYRTKLKIVAIAAVIALYLFTKDNEDVKGLVWERFEVEDGRLKGDNRASEELDYYFKLFLHSDYFLWGTHTDVAADSSSYKQFLIYYGFIFTILISILLLVISAQINKNVKGTFLSMLLYLALMYQRPYLFDFAYMFLIVSSFIQVNVSLNYSRYLKKKEVRLCFN
jgi:hypothetical protein